jgi:hypothetical protein
MGQEGTQEIHTMWRSERKVKLQKHLFLPVHCRSIEMAEFPILVIGS